VPTAVALGRLITGLVFGFKVVEDIVQ
jgi:hypothetical protein